MGGPGEDDYSPGLYLTSSYFHVKEQLVKNLILSLVVVVLFSSIPTIATAGCHLRVGKAVASKVHNLRENRPVRTFLVDYLGR